MERHERTGWGFLATLVVLGLLGTSLFLPWWAYSFSSGVKTPPGGPQDPADTRVERERLDVYPYRTSGHSNNTTAPDVAKRVGTLGNLVAASMAAAGLVAILELPVPFPFATRRLTLALIPVGFLLSIASLLYAWHGIPGMLATGGVDQAFTSKELPDGFVRTWITVGWVVGLVAVLVYPSIFAFKYQAGATDPTVIETFRTQPP